MRKRHFAALLGLILALFFSSCGRGPAPEEKTEPFEEIQPVQEAQVAVHDTKPYQALLEDPHMVIRLAAARVLLVYGDRSGEEILLEALKGDDTRHRLDAFLALSGSLTEDTIPVLQNAVEAEKNPMARYVMRKALKEAMKEFKLEN